MTRPLGPSRHPGGGHGQAEPLLMVVGIVAAAGIVVWLTGELAALVWRGRWPAVGFSDMMMTLSRLPGAAGHPGQAWPPAVRADLPAAGWLYLVAIAVLASVATAAMAARHLFALVRQTPTGHIQRAGRGRLSPVRPNPRGASRRFGIFEGRAETGARWATSADLRPLRVRRTHAGRLVLGCTGRVRIASEAHHSVLVLGPTQTGKTTALALPALLEWDGPVVATSVKDDLVANSRAFRSTIGRTWVFDPTATARAGPTSRWSPLVEASSWSGAQRVAHALVDATPSRHGLTEGAFWFAAAAKLLAPLLLAAARGGRSMAEVVRWTDLQETEEIERLLVEAGEDEAVVALFASTGRDERIRSSIYTTLETVLAPYQDPVVVRSADQPDIDPATLLSGRHTLYLCGPAHEQARVQGVFSALVGSIVSAAIERSYRLEGPLDPPLLLVLDEAANIAPLPDLDTLASTAAGIGIQLVTICQDLAQLTSRYGEDRARTIANNHRAKLVLSGVADIGTLETISGLAGEEAVREQTVTAERSDGRRSHSISSSVGYRRLAPTDELRRIEPGRGVLIYGHLPPARISLRPWYADPELARRVELSPAPLAQLPAPGVVEL